MKTQKSSADKTAKKKRLAEIDGATLDMELGITEDLPKFVGVDRLSASPTAFQKAFKTLK